MLRPGAKSNGKNQPVEKLEMDFAARSGRHGAMDDDNTELINLLCTRIGTIMEDTSLTALTLGSQGSDERLARIQQLTRASASIATLAAAVEALS